MPSFTSKTFAQPDASIISTMDACDHTPLYESDDGPLTEQQMADIRKLVPQYTHSSVRSSLLQEEMNE